MLRSAFLAATLMVSTLAPRVFAEPVVAPAVPVEAPPPAATAVKPSLAALDRAAVVKFLNDSLVDVFEKVSPAVVVISVNKKADAEDQGGDYFHDLFFPGGDKDAKPIQSEGSGFIVRADGYIYTNNHVVEQADGIKVTLKDGRELDAKVIGIDDRTDIAVLKVDATGLPTVEIGDSDKVRVGQLACAIGAPYNLDYTFTMGCISGKGRTNLQAIGMQVMYEEYIQTDASINPGNSGGPLLDMDGKVIGMNTLINGLNRGLGFAIPSSMFNEVGKELIDKGHITRPWLGIRIESFKDAHDLRKTPAYKGLEKGVVVVTIEPDTPAFQTDLRPADVITLVDGEPVGTDRELQKKILSKKVGQTVKLTVRRRENTLVIPVVTGELPTELTRVAATSPRPDPSETDPAPRAEKTDGFGVQVQALTPELAGRLGVDASHGVVVTEVAENSPAAAARILREDVISEVDNRPVSTPAEFEEAIKGMDAQRGALLFISRRGERTFAVLKPE